MSDEGASTRAPARLDLARFAPYALAALVVVAYAAFRLTEAATPGAPAFLVVTGLIYLGFDVAALRWLSAAARHPDVDRAERRSWWFVVAGTAVWLIGGHLYGATIDTAGVSVADPVLLAAYTAARVISLVLLLAGLLRLAARPLDRAERLKLLIDGVTVLGGGLMIIWYVLVGPALEQLGQATAVRVVVVLWPVLDLVMLTGLGAVLLRGARSAARLPLLLLLAAFLVALSADLAQIWCVLWAPDSTRIGFTAIGGLVTLALIAAAGRERCRSARTGARRAAPLRPHRSLPYLSLVLGFGVLVVAAVRSGPYPWPGLVLGAVIITAMTAGRQALALSEIRALSVTDPLTGLANRQPFWDAIGRATARSRRTSVPMAVLLVDLDGFKPVNDRHGHAAGDLVLVEFAALLNRCVRATDLVARLGGDEFAVVLEDVTGRRAVTVAERIQEQAARPVPLGPGRPPVTIGCSIGIAVGDPLEPEGVPAPAELLHRADRAMYRSKRTAGRGWAMDPAGPGPRDRAEPHPPAPSAALPAGRSLDQGGGGDGGHREPAGGD